MSATPWPRGLLTALVTPLRDDTIHFASLEALVEYQISKCVSGLVVSGGTGEYGALTFEERSRVISAVVQLARGRVPVIGATGCLTTRDAIRLSEEAVAAGVAGLLLASPYGEPINWRERYTFYQEVSASVSTPILIYNTPPAGLLSFDQIKELAQLERITGIKDSSGNPELMGDLITWAGQSEFGVYVGMDSFLYEAISTGARGAIFGAANFMPAEIAGLIAVLQTEGATKQALKRWADIRPVLRFMEQASNYVGLCKAGCKFRGIDVGDVRRPYLMPDAAAIDTLIAHLQTLIS
jgi:4-hydroxy-tetrahydrodipicolinate synthase